MKAYSELTALRNRNESVEKVYAGSYIDKDNVLVVQLTTDAKEILDIVQKSTISQEVRFRKQRYSYSELMKTYNKLVAIAENTKLYDMANSFALDEVNNAVEVRLRDISYEDRFRKEICDDACIRFIESRGDIVFSVGKVSPEVGGVEKVNHIRYTVTKKKGNVREVTVNGIEGKSRRSIVIPATVTLAKKTYKVVGIEKNAFKGMKKLKTVTISKNVRRIEDQAFKNCKRLATVKILSGNCSFSGKSIWKGTSKKMIIKVSESNLKRMRKRLKKTGIRMGNVKVLK